MKRSHFADLKKSKRLQQLQSCLGPNLISTMLLQQMTGSMAIHSDIHELRCNGVPVSNAVYMGMSESGRRIYGYRLEN